MEGEKEREKRRIRQEGRQGKGNGNTMDILEVTLTTPEIKRSHSNVGNIYREESNYHCISLFILQVADYGRIFPSGRSSGIK